MTAPHTFGGYEVPVRTQVEVLDSIARGCGSTSWVCAVYSVGVARILLAPGADR
jgi:hypothetical protein